jgi:hypothetical protein
MTKHIQLATEEKENMIALTLSNPIFLPLAYSPALIYFGRGRGWWITCNYPTVLNENNFCSKLHVTFTVGARGVNSHASTTIKQLGIQLLWAFDH